MSTAGRCQRNDGISVCIGVFTYAPRSELPFWDTLLPNAREAMVQRGLFTRDGQLTDMGRATFSKERRSKRSSV